MNASSDAVRSFRVQPEAAAAPQRLRSVAASSSAQPVWHQAAVGPGAQRKVPVPDVIYS